jgi:hypothetical protein
MLNYARRAPAELVVILYLAFASAVFATQWDGSGDYSRAILENLVFAVVLLASAREEALPKLLAAVRRFYPLVFFGIAYVQVGLFIRLVWGTGFTFDSLVASWDAALFGGNPHMRMHQALPGRFWAELMHFLYVLLYPLLFGGFLFVIQRRSEDYQRFAFVFLTSFLSFVVIFILFPVSGPMEYRQGLFPATVLLSNLVDYLFSFGIPSAGGAFPSLHVGMGVILFLLLQPISAGGGALILLVTLGIGVSMGYASVHYSIDAVAGVPAAIATYCLWNAAYRRIVRADAGTDIPDYHR